MTWEEYVKQNNLNMGNYNTGEQNALIEGFNNLNQPVGTTVNPMTQYMNTPGLGGITQGQWSNLGQAAGLAGTAYGLYDSILGNKADLYKQQIGMLKDQRANNAQVIADRKKFKENIGTGFSNAFSGNGGLAASSARVG